MSVKAQRETLAGGDLFRGRRVRLWPLLKAAAEVRQSVGTQNKPES